MGAQSFVTGEDAFLAQAADVPPPCNDNNSCTTDACVPSGTTAFCRNTPVAAGTSCADANTCNGVEVCNAIGQCQAGTNSAPGAGCPDGDACNGDELCNGTGSCVAGPPPTVSDDNPCTADACDPDTGVSNIPVPDGTSCAGSGVCTAGECSFQCAAFSEEPSRSRARASPARPTTSGPAPMGTGAACTPSPATRRASASR